MQRIATPRFLPTAERTWVRYEEAADLPGRESACVVNGTLGPRLVIAPSRHFNMNEQLVSAVKVGVAEDDETMWLVDFPSGDRLLVPQGLTQPRRDDPA